VAEAADQMALEVAVLVVIARLLVLLLPLVLRLQLL
jgi:hypothetical protein